MNKYTGDQNGLKRLLLNKQAKWLFLAPDTFSVPSSVYERAVKISVNERYFKNAIILEITVRKLHVVSQRWWLLNGYSKFFLKQLLRKGLSALQV